MEEEIKQEEEIIVEEPVWEESTINQFDRYTPTIYQIIGYKQSWKQCHCGHWIIKKA